MMRAVLVGTLLICSAAAMGAPIGLQTALPVARDEYLVRAQFVDLERSAVSGPAEMNAQALIGAIGYGFSPRLAGFAALPWLSKELESSGLTRRAEGLGDLTLFGRYTLFQNDSPGRTFRVAPVLGVLVLFQGCLRLDVGLGASEAHGFRARETPELSGI